MGRGRIPAFLSSRVRGPTYPPLLFVKRRHGRRRNCPEALGICLAKRFLAPRPRITQNMRSKHPVCNPTPTPYGHRVAPLTKIRATHNSNAMLAKDSHRIPGGGRGPGGGSPLAGVRGQSPRSLNGTPQRIICMHKQCKFLQNTQYFGVIQTSPI